MLPYRLSACLVSALLCSSCVSWIGRYGEPFHADSAEERYFEAMVTRLSDASKDSKPVRLITPTVAELRVEGVAAGQEAAFQARCQTLPVLLRFAWLSDVQLRQREVKLFSDRVSRDMNRLIPSFESHPMAEEYDWAAYLAQVLALNRYQKERLSAGERPLSFMIHTGDAIDAGSIEELYQFVYISNLLDFPWLNVLGNHDTAVFGNYDKAKNYALAADVEFYPAAQRRSVLWMHGPKRWISGFGHHLLPVPVIDGADGHEPTLFGRQRNVNPDAPSATLAPPSACHGFDLGRSAPGPMTSRRCADEPGYYAFDLTATQSLVPVRVIALDSPKKDGAWGAGAALGEPQIKWLGEQLKDSEKRVVLIFSHHPSSGFESAARALLTEHAGPNLFLFTGHTHTDEVHTVVGPRGRSFDLTGSALMNTPKVGHLVELRGQAASPGCLTTRWAWSSVLAASPEALAPPTSVDAQELARCDAEREVRRTDLAASVGCARLGAHADYLNKAAPIWGRPQDFAEGKRLGNVMLPLLIPASPAATQQSTQQETP